MVGKQSQFFSTSTFASNRHWLFPPYKRNLIFFTQMYPRSTLSRSILLLWLFQFSAARIFTLEMHHRFSDHVKEWSRRTGSGYLEHKWPVKGSVEYYALLVSHDRVLHGRRLSNSDGALTFSDGNSTLRISSLGL